MKIAICENGIVAPKQVKADKCFQRIVKKKLVYLEQNNLKLQNVFFNYKCNSCLHLFFLFGAIVYHCMCQLKGNIVFAESVCVLALVCLAVPGTHQISVVIFYFIQRYPPYNHTTQSNNQIDDASTQHKKEVYQNQVGANWPGAPIPVHPSACFQLTQGR